MTQKNKKKHSNVGKKTVAKKQPARLGTRHKQTKRAQHSNDFANHELFTQLRSSFDSFEDEREALIKESRSILKDAKAAIYATHRGDLDSARSLLEQAHSVKTHLDRKLEANPKLYVVGAYRDALEEYAEAMCFLSLVTTGRLPSRSELNVDYEVFLAGICDTIGELGRRGVNAAVDGDVSRTLTFKSLVEELYDHLMQFDFRNGPLRVKFDKIKYTLERLADIAVKVKLK